MSVVLPQLLQRWLLQWQSADRMRRGWQRCHSIRCRFGAARARGRLSERAAWQCGNICLQASLRLTSEGSETATSTLRPHGHRFFFDSLRKMGSPSLDLGTRAWYVQVSGLPEG